MTIFTNYLSISLLDFPFTCFFIDKWKGLLKCCLILLYDLKDILLKSNLEGIARILTGDLDQYHHNYTRNLYLYTKFKITNRELKELRNEFYYDLTKKKLNEISMGKIDIDQREPINVYWSEKKKIEKICKDYFYSYKTTLEDLSKKFLIVLSRYNKHKKDIQEKKVKFNILAEKKISYEKILAIYDMEIKAIRTMSNLNALKNDDTRNHSHIKDNKKIALIDKEKKAIYEKYSPIIVSYEKENENLLKRFEQMDKIKIELEKIEKMKKKREMQMRDYIGNLEQKEKELIKDLTEKLKLSEIFKKAHHF